MQIMYRNAYDRGCIVFQNRFQLFIGNTSFFHLALVLFPKIVFCAVQNTKGKLLFRIIENMQLWRFVSSVDQKRNPLNLNKFSQTLQIYAVKINIVRLQEIGFYSNFRHRRKCSLTFFLCV